MLTTRRDFLRIAASAGACTMIGASSDGPPDGRRPNVIWIVNDASRAKNYSCYGYERQTSPVIDRLAQRGALFRRAYSNAFWTSPSVSRYMTGSYFPEPCAGITFVGESVILREPQGEILAPVAFKSNGYRTLLLTGNSANVGAHDGFPTRLANAFHEALIPPWEVVRRRPDGSPMRKVTFKSIVDFAIPWIDRNSTDPFFAYLHGMETHSPFVIPAVEPFNQWIDEDYQGKWIRDGRVLFSHTERNRVEIEDKAQLVGLYDGGIRYADFHLSRLFDHLETQGLMDNTIIVFSSDHGEALFDDYETHSHYWAHSGADETHQIPLLISGPGIPANFQESGVVESIDILPTLVELCNLTVFGKMDGTSLTGFFRGETPRQTSPAVSINVPTNVFDSEQIFICSDEAKYEVNQDLSTELVWAIPDNMGHRVEIADVKPGLMMRMRDRLSKLKVPEDSRWETHYEPWAHRIFLTNRKVLGENEGLLEWKEGSAMPEEYQTRWIHVASSEKYGPHMAHYPSEKEQGSFEISLEFGVYDSKARIWIELATEDDGLTSLSPLLSVQVNESPLEAVISDDELTAGNWEFVDAGVFDAPFNRPLTIRLFSSNSTIRARSLLVFPNLELAESKVKTLMNISLASSQAREEALRSLGYID